MSKNARWDAQAAGNVMSTVPVISLPTSGAKEEKKPIRCNSDKSMAFDDEKGKWVPVRQHPDYEE